MAELLSLEKIIKSGVDKALNTPIIDGKSITEWAAVGMKAPRWVSVNDRLPEEPGRYLCWFGKNTFAVGASIVPYIPDLHWFASLESLERYENVTHWMPLPEAPKEAIE